MKQKIRQLNFLFYLFWAKKTWPQKSNLRLKKNKSKFNWKPQTEIETQKDDFLLSQLSFFLCLTLPKSNPNLNSNRNLTELNQIFLSNHYDARVCAVAWWWRALKWACVDK